VMHLLVSEIITYTDINTHLPSILVNKLKLRTLIKALSTREIET